MLFQIRDMSNRSKIQREFFRIEGNPNLCVENATNACPTPGKAKKSSTVYIAVGVAVGAVLGIAAAVTLCCLYSAKKKNAREPLLNAPAGKSQGIYNFFSLF
jgi:hypothetical protein